MSVGEVAILGAGMHPWGKWGRNFVEYGVVAAREALADRKSTRLNSSHTDISRMPSSA